MINVARKIFDSFFILALQDLLRADLLKDFRIMSTNRDFNKLRFISSIEHRRYPYYGVQFHPEKNSFEWIMGKKIPHGKNAIRASQYFADFFVNEGQWKKHSNNKFQVLQRKNKNILKKKNCDVDIFIEFWKWKMLVSTPKYWYKFLWKLVKIIFITKFKKITTFIEIKIPTFHIYWINCQFLICLP